VSDRDQISVWDVARPARAARIATLAGPRDYFAALAFSPRGNLLAGVTYHGSMLAFRLAGPARPVRVAMRPGLLARPRFPGGGRVPASPCGCGADAAYAAGFTPEGRALTVVIARPETWPSPAARDTVLTSQVAGSGCPHRPHHHLPRCQRRPADPGPGRPHRGRRLRHRRPDTPEDPALTRPTARAGI
jgi:hypothetical protein